MNPTRTKIVLVENDSLIQELIQCELNKSNSSFRVEVVSTETAYKKVLHDFKPDLILCNYILPSFNGNTAFYIRQKQASQTPFIFVSETIGVEIAIEFLKNGVTDFVFTNQISALNTKINRALREVEASKYKDKKNQELFQNEIQFRAFFDNSLNGMLLTVTDGQILTANLAACTIFQMTEQEIIDAGRFGLVDPTDSQLKILLEERQRNGWAKGELRLIRKNGSTFPAELTSVLFKDGKGEKRTSMIIRDLTDYKETQQKLAATSNELRQALTDKNKILDSSLDVICSFDEKGHFLHVNAASQHLWGYHPQELIDKKYMDLVFPDDAEITISAAIKIKSGLPVTTFENRFIHKNGKIVPLMWSSRWDDKEQLFFSIAKDTTEIKIAAKNLEHQNTLLAFQIEEKENRAAELVIANHELAFQNKEKGNRAAELVLANIELAFQNEEKENRATELVLANKELAFQNKEKGNRAAELVLANHELAFQNKEKENRDAELVIANHELAFQNKEKENRAAELILTNNELVKTNIELDRFVYSVSHDLRSPLTSVLGLISFIEEESQEADTLEHTKMIRNSINRLDEFIKNILSYSRNNRTGLEIAKIPVQQNAEAIIHSLHKMKKAKGIHFEVDIREENPFYSDWLRFNTILENLVSNAIKYHTKDKTDRYIKITGHSNQERLEFTIADNGIGINPIHHEKIFEMFFRLSGTEGSGIGLYIVKDTIEILEGSIEIQSKEGSGTTFIITLKNLKP